MDDAHTELESGTQPVYDRLRRPTDKLCLIQAVTQKFLQSHKLLKKGYLGLQKPAALSACPRQVNIPLCPCHSHTRPNSHQ